MGAALAHLFQPLLERAKSNADQAFCMIIQGQREIAISNSTVVADASAFGRAIGRLGVEKGAVVLIVLEHSYSLYPAFIGCVLAGFVPSFMSPLTRKQDPAIYHSSMQALIARIQPAAIVSSVKASVSIPQTNVPVVMADEIEAPDAESIELQLERAAGIAEDDTAFLQHSSGTTGLKKGVMLSHEAVLSHCRNYASAIRLQPGNTIVSWLPLYHDMGLIACFLLPAVIGARIVSLDALEWVMRPTILLHHIEQHDAEFAWLPNFAFQHIMRLDTGKRRWDLSSLKALTSCSEPCRAATFAAFLDRYAPAGLKPEALQVSYALAENVFAATQTSSGSAAKTGSSDATRGFVSCGVPLQHTEVAIRSSDGSLLPDGQVGEIWLRSDCLFGGYYRQPDLTRLKLIDGWYRTGDLGSRENGELFVIGRTDDLIIVNGKNLMAHEIEDELNEIGGLIPGRILVHSQFDDELGTAQLIILAERDADESATASIEATIRSKIYSASGVYPSLVQLLDRGFLIKSSSGKISRVASFDKFLNQEAVS